jgi:hypothetical protein
MKTGEPGERRAGGQSDGVKGIPLQGSVEAFESGVHDETSFRKEKGRIHSARFRLPIPRG